MTLTQLPPAPIPRARRHGPCLGCGHSDTGHIPPATPGTPVTSACHVTVVTLGGLPGDVPEPGTGTCPCRGYRGLNDGQPADGGQPAAA